MCTIPENVCSTVVTGVVLSMLVSDDEIYHPSAGRSLVCLSDGHRGAEEHDSWIIRRAEDGHEFEGQASPRQLRTIASPARNQIDEVHECHRYQHSTSGHV